MIPHVSLPAQDPRSTAETLARIFGGEAMPFPVIEGAWIAWAADGVTEIEIVPAGQGYSQNAELGREPTMIATPAGNCVSGWHVAISTKTPAAEIVRIARQAGWPAEICDRAGFFSLVEVWIDGTVLVEVFDQDMLARYSQAFTAKTWKAMLRDAPRRQGSSAIEELRARSR